MPQAGLSPRAAPLLVVGLVIGLMVTGAMVLIEGVRPTDCCADPPSVQQRADHERFVIAHLPDATDFEWTVSDCDDRGQASLTFTTRQRGTTATRAFLQDGDCRSSGEPDASTAEVACVSSGVAVTIVLEDHGAVDSEGELAPDLP